VLSPKLAKYTRDYPDVVLDITADDGRMDIVAGGYDAGIQSGEFIQKDMIAVRVSGDHRAAIVGSPSYFKAHPRRKFLGTCSHIDASISGMDMAATSIAGSSKRAENLCPLPSTDP
jgi:DNA-binding transcriptional LysR family regulator